MYSCTSPVDRGGRERGRVVPSARFTHTAGRASERGCGPTTHTCTCGPLPIGLGFPLPWTRPPLTSSRLPPTSPAWPLLTSGIMVIASGTLPPRQLQTLTAGPVCKGPTVAHACTRRSLIATVRDGPRNDRSSIRVGACGLRVRATSDSEPCLVLKNFIKYK